MEPPSIVADEVALEGLDGITIPSLWIRLEDRRPKFPLKLDDCTKGFIWSYLVSNVDFRFYELPQERENIELFDRYGLDPDTGVEKETLSSQHRDVYPIHVIPENKDGIQGSCAFFKQRKDITKKLRSQSLTPVINLEEALKMYGRKLVVVASQALRFRTLIGPESDPDLKLSSDSYCVLERVGRARWQGELQRDLHGGLFKADARKLHYLRKSLVIHDLITMQSYVRRLHSGQRQHSVLLLLKRFHISRRSKYDLLMESMSTFLQELPSQFSTVDMLKEHLNVTEPNLKRLFNYMRAGKFVQFCHYPLEDLCPSAGPCKNKNGSKVLVRCVKLLKPYTKKSVPEEEEDEDDEDEEDYSGARKGGGVPTVGRIMERDVLYQAYDFILSSGTKGVSQRDLSSRLNISLLESRITWRKLVKDGMFHQVFFSLCFHQNAHETYRVLKRKNLIVEAVRSSRIITGLYELQKKIIEEEQKDGLNSKCCKKTILRLVNSLSREGLVKMYTTTVIQDKITRKIDLIVHPSVQPEDESVKQIIEQIRFKISIPGLGKRLGFQPKMQRLRAIHTFLWYLIYGHPQKSSSTECKSANTTSLDPNGSSSDTNLPDGQAQQDLKETESSDVSFWDKEKLLDHESNLDFPLNNKVFVDEDSWRRFVPPVRQHEDFSSGWASVGDVLLCMPLSIFLQFTQINYKVDGLEELVNDPMKQHYLVSSLPPKMQRELLYRRKYILMFNENLQRLVYMGLLQFAPTERFKDKDQMFVYLKRNATIVDTTSTEPHYWQVSEPPDKPFERRSYTLNTADDVESYWFDLMCVCLNTPLGTQTHRHESIWKRCVLDQTENNICLSMLVHEVGSIEVCDDGSIPGDGKGAAGLDSEFFGHLKRNWLWTSHLLLNKRVFNHSKYQFNMLLHKCINYPLTTFYFHLFYFYFQTPTTIKTPQTQNRLKGLLNRDALRIALQAGERDEEGRNNKQCCGIGGKGQKRTKTKNEKLTKCVFCPKEPKPRAPAHDEADHRALKMMTKRRVYWTIQEDSVIMLCAVASYLLNSKVKVYVPYCIVRDLLHAEFQISEDKTSLAVGRRTKYILKNPQTYLNFRICLAEVYQDTTLLKHLEENKPVCPDNPEDCAKSFSEYIRLLRQKFSAVTSALDVIFPDSTQELFSRFKVSAIDDETPVQAKDTINSKEDIHATVLYNLIQSTLAMTNGQMKTSRSFQVPKLLYDQELLCKVFLQTRVDRLVNRRRVGQLTGPKKNRSLPILPMSFQLSQSYYRRFLWRFPSSLCTDSFCFLRNLLAKGSEDEKPFTKEPPDVSDMLRFTLNSPGGACAASLSLMSLGLLNVFVSIPKQIVVVDSNLVDNDVAKSLATLEEEDDEDEDDDNDNNVEGRKGLHVTSHQASHTNFLLMRGYCCPGIVHLRNLPTNDYIVVESCIVNLKLRGKPAHHLFTPPQLDLTKCGPSLLPSVLTAYIRSPSSSPPSAEECDRHFIEERGYTDEDIEVCTQLRRSLDEMVFFWPQDLQEEGQVVRVGSLGVRWVLMQHADPWLLTVNCKQTSRSKFTFERRTSLKSQHSIPSKRKRCHPEQPHRTEEPPAKKQKIDEKEKVQTRSEERRGEEKSPNLEEEGEMQTCPEREKGEDGQEKMETEQKLVRKRTRSSNLDEDGKEEAESVPTESADDEENVSFISRPWRFTDGKVNRPVCKGLLEAILYHIMSLPGVTQQALLEHYKNALQPVVVLDLVQALIELGCVTKKTLVKEPKPSLFARSVCQNKSVTNREEAETVFYEPTISCCLRLLEYPDVPWRWVHW
uniref:Ral transcription factor IIIC subunit 1 n=1 Tax=Nothobranchius furzeri TaxID=105023 RepID=A0A8C6NYI7_NOTFU